MRPAQATVTHDLSLEQLRSQIDALRQNHRQTRENILLEARRLTEFRDEFLKRTTSRISACTVPSPDPQPLDALTPREREVLRCIADGNSTRAAAAMLGITFKTAACHRQRIMQKLDAHETSSLVRYAIRSGIVRP